MNPSHEGLTPTISTLCTVTAPLYPVQLATQSHYKKSIWHLHPMTTSSLSLSFPFSPIYLLSLCCPVHLLEVCHPTITSPFRGCHSFDRKKKGECPHAQVHTQCSKCRDVADVTRACYNMYLDPMVGNL